MVKLQIQFLGMSSQALPWHTSLLYMYLKFSIFTLYHYTMGTSVMHTCKQFWSTLFFHIFSRLDSARYLLKLSSFVSAIAWSCYEWKACLLTILALAGMVEIVFLLMFVCFFTKMHVVLLYPCFVNFVADSSDKLANKNAAEPSEYL